jgi:hypothetical protein
VSRAGHSEWIAQKKIEINVGKSDTEAAESRNGKLILAFLFQCKNPDVTEL